MNYPFFKYGFGLMFTQLFADTTFNETKTINAGVTLCIGINQIIEKENVSKKDILLVK